MKVFTVISCSTEFFIPSIWIWCMVIAFASSADIEDELDNVEEAIV